MQQALEIRDFEIERRLDAFARARLNPDHAVVARTRARVMREARLQFEGTRNSTVVPIATLAARRPLARRLAMPLLAASMWLGIAVGSVAASQAGGPLYATRLWAETLTLPVNSAERAAAEIARLDARLGDAMTGAAHGDAGAVGAALSAYRQIADETVAASTGDERLEDIVSAALDRHRAVLTAVAESLESSGETTAAAEVEASIQKAIDHNAAVVAAFATKGGGSPSGTGTGDGPAGAGSGTGAGAGSGDAASGTGGGAGGTGGNPPGSGADEPGTGAGTGAGNGAANGAGNGSGSGTTSGDAGSKGKDPKPAPTDAGERDGQGDNP